MKIYTRTGDQGQTGLLGGKRVAKDHLRPETCGTVDELNALLGLVRTETLPDGMDELLGRIQDELFHVGAELASPDPVVSKTRTIGQQQVAALEAAIDRFEEGLPALTQFILPGGARSAASLHLARATCRRAERRLITLARESEEGISPDLGIYLNRLSDLLFVLARAANAASGVSDVVWRK